MTARARGRKSEKERRLMRCESAKTFRLTPSSPSILARTRKDGDCIGKNPLVIGDDDGYDKEAQPQVPTPKRCSSKNVKNEKLVGGDLGMVMEKLGISGDLDGDKLLDRLGSEDIENLFIEAERLEEVKEAFDVFDENNDGYIDAKELEKILCKLGIVEVPRGEPKG
ncbi:hypothetical protein RJ640_001496 [Escallonia rubra]|uniref:EF-hand domain-containing protein n=1 Tax=Escallonia rubra TaxID=112253 RepID=A0AA88RQL1_9ASTE|nr:hypothetical protein RJ640_001496 [Escallonia rubra]